MKSSYLTQLPSYPVDKLKHLTFGLHEIIYNKLFLQYFLDTNNEALIPIADWLVHKIAIP